jgi:hypothetical protein
VFSTLADAALGLLKPWPIAIIIDHAMLAKPLPPFLGFIDGIAAGNKNDARGHRGIRHRLDRAGRGVLRLSREVHHHGDRLGSSTRCGVFSHLQSLSLSFPTVHAPATS